MFFHTQLYVSGLPNGFCEPAQMSILSTNLQIQPTFWLPANVCFLLNKCANSFLPPGSGGIVPLTRPERVKFLFVLAGISIFSFKVRKCWILLKIDCFSQSPFSSPFNIDISTFNVCFVIKGGRTPKLLSFQTVNHLVLDFAPL